MSNEAFPNHVGSNESCAPPNNWHLIDLNDVVSSAANQAAPAGGSEGRIASATAAETHHMRDLVSLNPKEFQSSITGTYAREAGTTVMLESRSRPGLCTLGDAIDLVTNAISIEYIASPSIYQYAVDVGQGVSDRVLLKRLWKTKEIKISTCSGVVWDGKHTVWSKKPLRQVSVRIDLRTKKSDGYNVTFKLERGLRPCKKHLSGRKTICQCRAEEKWVLARYCCAVITEQAHFDSAFHLIKGQLFLRADGHCTDLSEDVEVIRGIKLEPMQCVHSGLLLSISDFFGVFFKHKRVIDLKLWKRMQRAQCFEGSGIDSRPSDEVRWAAATLRGSLMCFPVLHSQYAWQEFRNFCPDTTQDLTADTEKHPRRFFSTGSPKYPLLRLRDRGKTRDLAADDVTIMPCQKYRWKHYEGQTIVRQLAMQSSATRCKILGSLGEALTAAIDGQLEAPTIGMTSSLVTTEARVLRAPTIELGDEELLQPLNGQLNMKNRTFLQSNAESLVAWGIGFMSDMTPVAREQIEALSQAIILECQKRGMQIDPGCPHMMPLEGEPAEAIGELHRAVQLKYHRNPQLLIVIVQDHDASIYQQLKQSCQSMNAPSQILHKKWLARSQDSIPRSSMSNVVSKMNAKLGGKNWRVQRSACKLKRLRQPSPTMVIGAYFKQVAFEDAAEIVSFAISSDADYCQYSVATGLLEGDARMPDKNVFMQMLGPIVEAWVQKVGGGRPPGQIYYFRDNSGRMDLDATTDVEVRALHTFFIETLGPHWTGALTCIAACRASNVLAGTSLGDDPQPGTLIDLDIVSTEMWDFLLFTANDGGGARRPTRYTVLMDDAEHDADDHPMLVYEQCCAAMHSPEMTALPAPLVYARAAARKAKMFPARSSYKEIEVWELLGGDSGMWFL